MQTELHPFVSASRRHNPHGRAVLLEHGSWLVLLHPRNSPEFAELQSSGQLVLQLWNRNTHISILGPSAETGCSYEIFPINDEAIRIPTYQGVLDFIKDYGLPSMPEKLVSDLYACFVLSAFIGVSPIRNGS